MNGSGAAAREGGKRLFGRDVNMVRRQDPFRTVILRTIVIGQAVTEEQGERLLYVAKHCPAARLLEGEIVIDSVLEGTIPQRAVVR